MNRRFRRSEPRRLHCRPHPADALRAQLCSAAGVFSDTCCSPAHVRATGDMTTGNRSVMGLRALRRHRHLPAAAALIGVLLYTALVASHVVSQATSLALPGAPGAVAQSITTGDPGCHETQPSAGKARESRTAAFQSSPTKKCPFCAGYAALHISVVGDPVSILWDSTVPPHIFAGFGDGHLTEPWPVPIPGTLALLRCSG